MCRPVQSTRHSAASPPRFHRASRGVSLHPSSHPSPLSSLPLARHLKLDWVSRHPRKSFPISLMVRESTNIDKLGRVWRTAVQDLRGSSRFELGKVGGPDVTSAVRLVPSSLPPRAEFNVSEALTSFSLSGNPNFEICFSLPHKIPQHDNFLYLSPFHPPSHRTTKLELQCLSYESQLTSASFFLTNGQRLHHTRHPKRAGSRQRESPFLASLL